MDRPLDDLIKEKHQQNKNKHNKPNNFKGKISNANKNKQERRQEPYKHKVEFHNPVKQHKIENLTFSISNNNAATTQNKKPTPVSLESHKGTKLSIFERIGNQNKTSKDTVAATSGTAVTISNINNDVTLADLSELCGAVGEVLGVFFEATTSKTSKKIANVRFARRSDALTFVQKFHNLPLDGIPLSVCLSGENGKENPFNPTLQSMTEKVKEPKNVRSGLFGTRMNQNDDEEDDEEDGGDEDEFDDEEGEEEEDVHEGGGGVGARFTVTMKGTGVDSNYSRPQSAHNNGGRRVNNFHSNEQRHSGGGGGGGGFRDKTNRNRHSNGSAGGGRSNSGENNFKKKDHSGSHHGKKNVSSGDLDNDLDNYFAAR